MGFIQSIKHKGLLQMTRLAKQLVDEFGEAAKYHGWQQDQGTGRSVDAAEEGYKETKAVLMGYITKLQKQNKRLRNK